MINPSSDLVNSSAWLKSRDSCVFCVDMTAICATCNTRILSNEWRCNYYETNDGNHTIGNYVTKVKRRDGNLEKCCRKCYQAAKDYVCYDPCRDLPELKFLLCVPFFPPHLSFQSRFCRALQGRCSRVFLDSSISLWFLLHF
jgi:hypothetical protein